MEKVGAGGGWDLGGAEGGFIKEKVGSGCRGVNG